MDIKIKWVEKHVIYPAFGYALPLERVVYIRKDLPKMTHKFVLTHEKYHVDDGAKWWVWREIKANAYAAVRHPIGFLRIVWMSVSSFDRWVMYFKRIKDNK